MLSVIPIRASPSARGANWLSMRHVRIRKPRFLYTAQTCRSAFISVSDCWLTTISAVPNLMFREIDTRKGIRLTNIRSTLIMTLRYFSTIGSGTRTYSSSVRGPCRRTVFPFKLPTSGPKICSAVKMSCLVIGQFGKRLRSTISMNCRVLGRPMVA